MMFRCELMADPVVASDGNTYERDSIELWMKSHDVSPHTNTPFDHKMLNGAGRRWDAAATRQAVSVAAAASRPI